MREEMLVRPSDLDNCKFVRQAQVWNEWAIQFTALLWFLEKSKNTELR